MRTEALMTVITAVIVLIVLAYVGHLFWLGISWLFRALFMGSKCPGCGRRLIGNESCLACANESLDLRRRPSVSDDLIAAERLRQYAGFQGWLEDEQNEYLKDCLTKLRLRVSGMSVPQVTVPQVPGQLPKSESPLTSTTVSIASIQTETQPVPAPLAIATPHLGDCMVTPVLVVAQPATPIAPVNAAILAPPVVHAQVTATQSTTHALDADYEPSGGDSVSGRSVSDRSNGSLTAAHTPLRAQVLRSFMERSNIRWVELVSASLVVVCSVGLVISLWSTLSRTSRFFPSLVFMLATLAVHGAGQYTLSRWKLRTTSRGILHIGLMLIPLSVLVGILLAHRQGEQTAFDFNIVSVLAIGIGLVVYGGLAITASRALFAKYFMPIAACTILASAALVPIDLASRSSASIESWSATTLMPVVLVSMIVSLLLTRQSAWRYRWTNAFARRHMGMAVQALFVSITACVFWFLKFKPGLQDEATTQFLNAQDWWWLAVGLMGVAWSAWGWTVSLARGSLASQNASNQVRYGAVKPIVDREAGWFVVASWVLATVATLALAVGIWRANESRISMVLLLSIGGAWWVMHGLLSRLSLPQLLGSLSLLLAGAIGSESIHIGWNEPLAAMLWISQERLTWMTIVGAAAAVLATVAVAVARSGAPATAQSTATTAAEPFDLFMIKHLVMAGCAMMLGSACLTVVASCLPIGPTPFGGQWSAWYLAFYGLVLSAIAIGLERDERWLPSITAAGLITPLILPIGLAVSILATIRFTQASDRMPEWIIALRPARAWSVGLTTLATLWALLAVVLKQFGWPVKGRQSSGTSAGPLRLSSIDWLNLCAIGISCVSLLGVVRLTDHLDLVARLHWQLPLICAAVWWSWRSSNAREFMLLTGSGWCVATLYSIGQARDWWDGMPLVVSVTSHVAIGCAACFSAGLLTRYFMVQRRASESPTNAWMFQPIYWATATVSLCSMLAMLLALALPALHNLGLSLGLIAELENNAPQLPLSFMKPSVLQAMGVVGTIILWSLTTFLGSRLPQLAKLRLALGLAPVLFALTLTASVPSVYALSVCLAVLSLSLIASELMTLFFKQWSAHSEASWQMLASLQHDERPEANLLLIGRIVAVCSLLGLTGLAIFLGWDGRLATNLLPAIDVVSTTTQPSRWPRLFAVLGWMWPALSFLMVRWSFALARDVGPGRVTLIGNVLALLIACTASLVGMAATIPFLYGSVTWLQWFVIAVATLAGVNAGATLLRNFIGLRAMDRGQTSAFTLLSKAAGGGRWKRAATSSHQLLWGGLACMVLLSAIAAASNIMVPIRALESIHALSVWPTVLAYGLLAVVLTWLWRSTEARGQKSKLVGLASYAGLIALLLGLLAPLGAVFYADWLEAVPSRYSVQAKQFEPYRAQVVTWLVVLGIGLAMRLLASQKRWPVSGEVLWVSLSVLVGVLAFVSSAMDPQPVWAASELGALAVVAVLSGCFSGQAWRGHIAAVIAGAACLTLASPRVVDEFVEMSWHILIGPLLIAAVALAWQLFTQRRTLPSERAGEAATRSPLIRNFKTVDQTVSQHVPIAIGLVSGFWVVLREVTADYFQWPVVAAVGAGAWILATARMWDVRRGGRGLAIYSAFVAAALTVAVLIGHFNELPLETRGLIWMACGLGALAVVAGCLREWLRESSRWIPALRMGPLAVEREEFDRARRWLVPWHSCVGLLLLIPCVLLALVLDERVLRLANAALPLLSGLSILPIAIDASQRFSRSIGLWLISIPLVLFLWADLPIISWESTSTDEWYYAQRTMVALVLLGWGHWALTHWLAEKLDWPKQLYLSSWISFAGAMILGCWMVISGTIDAWPRVAHSATLATQLVWLLTWVGLIGRAIQFALRPVGLDCQASLKMRQAAVYATEFGLAMLASATYLCFPDLFAGLIADWWPLVVYGIAMLSAAIGHWATVSKQEVIADPVRRSSLLLPLVPLLGVWLPFSRELDIDWSSWQSYSLVLFGGAALYALHGWLKPSVKIHALAGVLALLSFWALLHSRPSLQFFEHPQFWVIPPAVATLIFVETNRRRLDANVVTAARYMAILLAYLSSTAEIVLKAFEGQMWQPLLLLMLAVVGMLAGIALRVRAFLFCGATFVMVALLGMVWHAQQAIDQVWPWWAFGILTGVSLIVMLGYFEKNRPRVLAYVDRLKSWEM